MERKFFYACGYLLVENISIWTHLIVQVSGDKSKIKPQKIITNQSLIAIVIGFTMFMLNLRFPTIIGNTISGLSSVLAPSLLLVMGMILGGMSLKEIFGDRHAYWICFVRLLVLPIPLVLVFSFVAVGGIPKGQTVETVIPIEASASIASAISMFVYIDDFQYASLVASLSTVLCMIIIPLVIAVSQMLY